MCLLVDQKEGTIIEDSWIHDFYQHNADGVGVMWAEEGTIHVVKQLPANKEALVQFFRDHIDGKKCAWHLRMRTHGDTDLENCHPYQVFSEADGYPIYLMHNGVLHTGNNKDTTKSDTWHFINDIIRPALKADPTQFMSEWFQELISDYIGKNNKFVMMDAFGNTVTFNRSSGVTWRECWFSNTYAWSAPMNKPYRYNPMSRLGYGLGNDYEDEYDYAYGYGNTATSTPIFKDALAGGAATPHHTYEDTLDTLDTLDAEEVEADAYEFAALFFDALIFLKMNDVYEELAFDDVLEYYLDYPTSAMQSLQDLEEGYLSEAEVREMFLKPARVTVEPERLKVGMQ